MTNNHNRPKPINPDKPKPPNNKPPAETLAENEIHAAAVATVLSELFDNQQHDNPNLNPTEFFIGIIKGTAMLYARLTSNNKNFLEFTHLCNQLIVQDLLARQEHNQKGANQK